LETHLNFGKDAKESQLQAAYYIPDTQGHVDNDAANTGLVDRSRLFRDSAPVQVMAPIHCDLFAQNRYMLNQLDLRVQIYRNSDNFALMRAGNNNNFKISMVDMRWYVKMVDVQSSVTLAIERTIQRTPVKYPVRRVEVKTMHIAAGLQECPQTPIFNGQVPRRLVLGLVRYDAYIGNIGRSPFNFQPFNISELSVTAAGRTVPNKPLSMNFADNRYMRAFVQLFEGLGMGGEDKGNGIDLQGFKSGSTLFAFDLSPDEDDGSHWDLIKDGATYVNMRFSQDVLAGGLELVAYAEFDNLISIDRTRNPFMDYKV
jgi:hypothetical protein